MANVCTLPPTGWICTRGAGHGGPCAAHTTEALIRDAIRYPLACPSLQLRCRWQAQAVAMP